MLIQRIEKLMLAMILGLIAPLLGLLASWWSMLSLLPETGLKLAVAGGVALGLLMDVLFLKRWVIAAHRLDERLWAAIFLFYSVVTFGLFMGVPVVNALLAVPAGFVAGSRLASRNAGPEEVLQAARRTARFTTIVLAVVCAASAVLALNDPFTAGNLEGMLRLSFTVTPGMLLALTAFGGAALLTCGWCLAGASVRFAYTFLHREVPAP